MMKSLLCAILLFFLVSTAFSQDLEIELCEGQEICLVEYLPPDIDPGGLWTGENGFVASGSCASLTAFAENAGIYTYNYIDSEGNDQEYEILVSVNESISLGVLQSVAYCENEPFCLNNFMPLEEPGEWYDPDGNALDGCTVDPLTDLDGVYTYAFYGNNDCPTTAGLEITFGYVNTGEYTEYSFCELDGSLTPFEVLNGNPDEGGQWTLYEANDDFIAFFPNWAFSLSTEYLQENLNDPSNFYLVYLLGAEPCPPSADTLRILSFYSFNPGPDIQVQICYNPEPLDLTNYLGFDAQPGGTFLSPITGDTLSNPIDLANYNPGDTVQANYTGGLPNTSCQNSSLIEIVLLPSDINLGEDVELEVCENESPIDLNDFIAGNPNDTQYEGIWTGPNGSFLENSIFTPGLSAPGTYAYQGTYLCTDDFLFVTINLLPTFQVSNFDTLCTADLQTYTVSFDIDEGAPPYSVNGTVLTGNNFTSASIPLGTPYSFLISDGNGCSIDLMGESPTCPCPASAQWPAETDTICIGESYEIQPDLEGQAPFDLIYEVNGLQVVLTNIFEGFTLNLSPDQTTSYTLISVSDQNCLSNLDQTFTLVVNESGDCCPEISAQFSTPDTTVCQLDELCVQAEITGGTPPYFISYLDVNNQIVIPVGTYFSGDCIQQIQNESNTYILDFVADDNFCKSNFTLDTLQITTDPDSDGDGICDSDEIAGCQNPNALNYNPLATDPAPCELDGGLSEDDWELSEIQLPFGDPDYDWAKISGNPNQTKFDFLIVPNPSNDGRFELLFPESANFSQLQIYSADGRMVFSETIQTDRTSKKINLEAPSGFYTVLMKSNTGCVNRRVLISK